MACLLKLIIKSGASRSSDMLKTDAFQILKQLESAPFISSCPDGMSIGAFYTPHNSDILFIYLARTALSDPLDHSKMQLHARIAVILRNLKLLDFYDLIVEPVSQIIIPPRNGGFLIEEFAQKVSPISEDCLPGYQFVFTRRPELPHFPQIKIIENTRLILRDLNTNPVSVTLSLNETVKLYPIYLVTHESQGFTLALPMKTLNINDKFREALQTKLKNLGHNDYYISRVISEQRDCLKAIGTKTNNETTLKLIGFPEEKIPGKYICELSSLVMDEPVILPQTNNIVDHGVLLSAYEKNPENPFNRQPIPDVFSVPQDVELQREIATFVNEQVKAYCQTGKKLQAEKKYDTAIDIYGKVFVYYKTNARTHAKEYSDLQYDMACAFYDKQEIVTGLALFQVFLEFERTFKSQSPIPKYTAAAILQWLSVNDLARSSIVCKKWRGFFQKSPGKQGTDMRLDAACALFNKHKSYAKALVVSLKIPANKLNQCSQAQKRKLFFHLESVKKILDHCDNDFSIFSSWAAHSRGFDLILENPNKVCCLLKAAGGKTTRLCSLPFDHLEALMADLKVQTEVRLS